MPGNEYLWAGLDSGDGSFAEAAEHLVDALNDAVIVADVSGTIRTWNRGATRLFGWDRSDAVGQSLDLIIPERFRERHWEGYEQVMETGQTSYGSRLLEVPAQHRDGRTISVAFTVSLLPGDDGPAGIIAVLRDDTARRQELRSLQQQLSDCEAAPVSGGGTQ